MRPLQRLIKPHLALLSHQVRLFQASLGSTHSALLLDSSASLTCALHRLEVDGTRLDRLQNRQNPNRICAAMCSYGGLHDLPSSGQPNNWAHICSAGHKCQSGSSKGYTLISCQCVTPRFRMLRTASELASQSSLTGGEQATITY